MRSLSGKLAIVAVTTVVVGVVAGLLLAISPLAHRLGGDGWQFADLQFSDLMTLRHALAGVEAQSVLGAVLVSLPVAFLSLGYLDGKELTANRVLISTLMRPATTILLAGVVALCFSTLRTPLFFLLVALIYLANLAAETWFALSTDSRPCGRKSFHSSDTSTSGLPSSDGQVASPIS